MIRLSALLFLATSIFAADPALRIEGVAAPDGTPKPELSLSLSDLAAMPRVSQRVKAHDGKEHTFEGVAVAQLLQRGGLPQGEAARGKVLTRYLVVSAHDGYRVVFSLPELDPAFSDSRALIADRVDGQPLSDQDGPLQLILPSEKVYSRWVRMVERLQVLTAPDAGR